MRHPALGARASGGAYACVKRPRSGAVGYGADLTQGSLRSPLRLRSGQALGYGWVARIRGRRAHFSVEDEGMAGKRWGFKYGELLPADDPVSKWLLAVWAATDDASRAAAQYIRSLNDRDGDGTRETRTAEALYFLKVWVAHTAEGLDHVLLKGYSCDERSTIERWIQSHAEVKDLWERIHQARRIIDEQAKAFRHSAFHYLAQYYAECLEEQKDVETSVSVPRAGTLAVEDRPFAELVAVPQLLTAHKKAMELANSKDKVPECPMQWLASVAKPVMQVCSLLVDIAFRAFACRAAERGI